MQEPEPSDARLLLRLGLGALSVGEEELERALRSWSREARARAATVTDGDAHPIRHRVVGALVTAPTHTREAAARARRSYRRTVGPWVSAVGQLVARTAPGRRLRARARELRDRLRLESARWEVIGRAEESEARALVSVGREAITDAVFERLAEDPAIRDLVAEQSASLGEAVLEEARDFGESADERLESALRRVFRRGASRRRLAGRGSER